MYCEKCGVKNNKTSEYCAGCGIKLNQSEIKIYEPNCEKIKKVPNYLIRSVILLVFNVFFSCAIMGIIPLIFSIITLVYSANVDKKIREMNTIDAEDFSKSTKLWFRITFLTTLISLILFLIIILVIMFNNNSIIQEYIQEYLNYVNNSSEF